MRALAQVLDSILAPVRKVLFVVVASMFGLQVIVVFFQVVMRFVFNNPPRWSEELAIYLQVWIVFLASSICIKEGSHLMVDYLVHYLPFRFKRRLKLLVMLLIMIFVSVLIVHGTKMLILTRFQTSPALHLPMGAVYLIFPVAGILMLLESLVVLLKTFSSSNTAELEAVEKAER
jgi:TRAP-type C4-dicarboxylate transport system permease small subunit